MHKSMASALFAILTGLFFTATFGVNNLKAQTTDVGEPPIHSDVINITVGEWPPYISHKLKHNGVIAHIIESVFMEAGIKVRFQFMPWARAYEEAATGRFDGTAVWLLEDSRKKDFLYSDALVSEKFVFFHLKSFNFDWQNIQDLKTVVIGGNHKSTYGSEIDAALEKGFLKMDRVTGYKQNFDRLLLRRIQLFPMEMNVGYFLLRKNYSEKIQKTVTHHSKALFENFSHLLFSKKSKKSAEMWTIFNEKLKLFRENGLYDEYMSRMLSGYYDNLKPIKE